MYRVDKMDIICWWGRRGPPSPQPPGLDTLHQNYSSIWETEKNFKLYSILLDFSKLWGKKSLHFGRYLEIGSF